MLSVVLLFFDYASVLMMLNDIRSWLAAGATSAAEEAMGVNTT